MSNEKFYSFCQMGLLLSASLFTMPANSGELWRTELTMKQAGQVEMKLPAQTHCQKVSSDFFIPLQQQQSADCQKMDSRREGDRLRWRVNCPAMKGEGELRGVGSGVMQGQMRVETPQGQFELTFKGTRIGACDGAQPDAHDEEEG